MHRALRLSFAAFIASLLLLVVGCPHRSPLWSPDGKHLAVLAGAKSEKVDKPASELWLVEVEKGTSELIPPPAESTRYLGAAWIGNGDLVVLVGHWEDEQISEESGTIWMRNVGLKKWQQLTAPVPSEERTPRRPPIVLRGPDGEHRCAYAAGPEAVVVVALTSGKKLLELEPAELVGPGPQDGFLVYRPEEGGGSGTALVAFSGKLEELWKVKFSELRDQIAAKTGKKPVEVIFNDTSTSHLPPGPGTPAWVGVTLVFNDVGWRDGIPGYYVQLDPKDGKLLRAAGGLGLSGQPAATGHVAWYFAAPDTDASTPPTLTALDLDTGKTPHTVPFPKLNKDAVHGYSLDAEGKFLAVSLNEEPPRVVIYPLAQLSQPRTVKLEKAR